MQRNIQKLWYCPPADIFMEPSQVLWKKMCKIDCRPNVQYGRNQIPVWGVDLCNIGVNANNDTHKITRIKEYGN